MTDPRQTWTRRGGACENITIAPCYPIFFEAFQLANNGYQALIGAIMGSLPVPNPSNEAAKLVKQCQLRWNALNLALKTRNESAKDQEWRERSQALMQAENRIKQVSILLSALETKKDVHRLPLPTLSDCTKDEKVVYLRILQHLRASLETSLRSTQKVLGIVNHALTANSGIRNIFRLSFMKQLFDQLQNADLILRTSDAQTTDTVNILRKFRARIGSTMTIPTLKTTGNDHSFLAKLHHEISEKTKEISAKRDYIMSQETQIKYQAEIIKNRKITRPNLLASFPGAARVVADHSHPLNSFLDPHLRETQSELLGIYRHLFANKHHDEFLIDAASVDTPYQNELPEGSGLKAASNHGA